MTSDIERYQAELYRGDDTVQEGIHSLHASTDVVWYGFNELLRKSRDLVGQSSDQIDKGVSILAAALEGSPRKDVLLTEIAEAMARATDGDPLKPVD